MRFLRYPAAFLCLLAVACSSPKKEDKIVPALEKDPLILNRDTTLNPGDNFFMYACGTWLKQHPIPGNEKGWGIWSMVQEETYTRMRNICEEAATAKGAPGSLAFALPAARSSVRTPSASMQTLR